jgi:hypothetical protein
MEFFLHILKTHIHRVNICTSKFNLFTYPQWGKTALVTFKPT